MLTTVLLTVATWYELTVQLAALAPNMLCMLLVYKTCVIVKSVVNCVHC